MAVTIDRYNRFVYHFGGGTINLASDSFKLALMTAAHIFAGANETWAQVSANEIAAGAGYLATGQALTTVSWTEAAGLATWNADDVTWNATGGAIAAAHGVLYDDTPISPADPLAFSINFDGLQTANDGTPFVVAWNVAGIFEI